MTMTMRAGHPNCLHTHASNLILHSMTTLPHASHVFRKKGYAPHYTPTSLAQFQPEIHQSALELVNVWPVSYRLPLSLIEPHLSI
jgi:hypothetical protein